MNFAKNINYLRLLHGQTQEELSREVGVNRKRISAYEKGVVPKAEVILKFAQYFDITMDDIVCKDLAKNAQELIQEKEEENNFKSGQSMRVLSITVNEDDDENVELVPEKASAGYTMGYADPEFIKDLPRFKLPFLSQGRTYRAFEIKGDSMLPLSSGSVVIAELVLDWTSVKEGAICVVVSNTEGVVLKKVYDQSEKRGTLLLKSNNPIYPHYEIDIHEVHEVWQYVAHLSSDFPEQNIPLDVHQTIEDLKDEIYTLSQGKR